GQLAGCAGAALSEVRVLRFAHGSAGERIPALHRHAPVRPRRLRVAGQPGDGARLSMDGHQTTEFGSTGLDALPRRAGPVAPPLIIDRRAGAWRAAVAVLVLGSAVILLLCRGPVLGALRVWIESATFNHCFLILPISLYMIWERRARW